MSFKKGEKMAIIIRKKEAVAASLKKATTKTVIGRKTIAVKKPQEREYLVLCSCSFEGQATIEWLDTLKREVVNNLSLVKGVRVG